MLVLREHVSDTGHKLGLFRNQRLECLSLRGCWNALTAEDHATQAQRGLAQVRDSHVALERTHTPGAILAHDKLQMVTSGSEHKAGVVLDIFAAHLLASVQG